jgi:RNA polymerase sigma factor (sigma-70 family)
MALTSSQQSDMAICAALASGEAWAPAALYDRVACVVDGVLQRVLGRGDSERDDVAQEAFERIISSIIAARFTRDCSLKTWSAVITQNLAVDLLRRRKRDPYQYASESVDTDLAELASPADTPEKALDVRRRFERLLTALQSVRSPRAEAFVLHDVIGHELDAVARMTGVSPSAAQSRLVRGRKDVLRVLRVRERADKR